MKIYKFSQKAAFLFLEFIFAISFVLCTSVQEFDSELDLSLVTPYEIKPTCANCTNTNMTLFSDSFLQFNQDSSLKNLIRKTETDFNQDISTLETESDLLTNTTIDFIVKSDVTSNLTSLSNASISSNNSIFINNINRPELFANSSLSNASITQMNSSDIKFNKTNSSTILITLMSTERTAVTISQKNANEITSPDIESNASLLGNI